MQGRLPTSADISPKVKGLHALNSTLIGIGPVFYEKLDNGLTVSRRNVLARPG